MKNMNKQDIASTLYRKVREKQLKDFKNSMPPRQTGRGVYP